MVGPDMRRRREGWWIIDHNRPGGGGINGSGAVRGNISDDRRRHSICNRRRGGRKLDRNRVDRSINSRRPVGRNPSWREPAGPNMGLWKPGRWAIMCGRCRRRGGHTPGGSRRDGQHRQGKDV
jgi:hypothetical protein